MNRLHLRHLATAQQLWRRRRPMGRARSRASCRRRSRGTRRSTRCCCRGKCEPPAGRFRCCLLHCTLSVASCRPLHAAHHPSHAWIHYDVACSASSGALRAAPSRSALHLSTAEGYSWGTHGVLTQPHPSASTAACRHTLHCASGQGFGDAALAAASMCRAYGAAAAEDSEVGAPWQRAPQTDRAVPAQPRRSRASARCEREACASARCGHCGSQRTAGSGSCAPRGGIARGRVHTRRAGGAAALKSEATGQRQAASAAAAARDAAAAASNISTTARAPCTDPHYL